MAAEQRHGSRTGKSPHLTRKQHTESTQGKTSKPMTRDTAPKQDHELRIKYSNMSGWGHSHSNHTERVLGRGITSLSHFISTSALRSTTERWVVSGLLSGHPARLPLSLSEGGWNRTFWSIHWVHTDCFLFILTAKIICCFDKYMGEMQNFPSYRKSIKTVVRFQPIPVRMARIEKTHSSRREKESWCTARNRRN